MSEVGTFEELDLKPGDVVKNLGSGHLYIQNGSYWTIVDAKDFTGRSGAWSSDHKGIPLSKSNIWCVVSRATDATKNDEPKLWRDMTREEKVAILLAALDGEVIEFHDGNDWFIDDDFDPKNSPHIAYRIKPEPKRETVALHGGFREGFFTFESPNDTYRITIDLIDGKPDMSSIKMEGV